MREDKLYGSGGYSLYLNKKQTKENLRNVLAHLRNNTMQDKG